MKLWSELFQSVVDMEYDELVSEARKCYERIREFGIVYKGDSDPKSFVTGLAVAAEEMYRNLEENRTHLYALRDYFIEEVEKLDGVSVNGKKDHDSAPHIVSVSIEGVRAEVILHTLEDRNIYVSAGSACSSNKPAISSTLKSIGVKKELLDSTVRFSFSIHTTKEELDYALQVMRETIPMLQRYTRH